MDVAFFANSNETGIGMVVRNDKGDFILAKSLSLSGCLSVDLGEAMGFSEVLSWVKSLQLDRVIVEGDAKIVIDAINSSY